jgi:hypothetical protein
MQGRMVKNLNKYKQVIYNESNQKKLSAYYENSCPLSGEIKQGSFLNALVELDNNYEEVGATCFHTLCKDATNLINSTELDKLKSRLDVELKSITSNPAFSSSIRASDEGAINGFILHRGKNIEVMIFTVDKFNLQLYKATKGVKGFTIHPADTVMFCLDGLGEYQKFSLCSQFDDDLGPPPFYDGNTKIGSYEPKKVINIYKGRDGFTFKSCEKPSYFLSITSLKHNMLVKPQYSVDDNRLLGVTHADNNASRIQMASFLLRMLKVDEAVDVLKPILNNNNLYIRWQIAREIYLLEPKSAKLIFLKLIDDPSAQIREAAVNCLSEFYGEEYATIS